MRREMLTTIADSQPDYQSSQIIQGSWRSNQGRQLDSLIVRPSFYAYFEAEDGIREWPSTINITRVSADFEELVAGERAFRVC